MEILTTHLVSHKHDGNPEIEEIKIMSGRVNEAISL